MVIEIKKHVLWKFNLNCLRDKIPKMAGPQVCPDFSGKPLGVGAVFTAFGLIFFGVAAAAILFCLEKITHVLGEFSLVND